MIMYKSVCGIPYIWGSASLLQKFLDTPVVWALISYPAAHMYEHILTVKLSFKLFFFVSDFSNFIGKPSIRAIAEADDHEVVREVQVIRYQ